MGPTAPDTLPPAAELHAALSTHQKLQLAAALAEFDDATPGQWMNYVPAVGIGYNLQVQPRPTISFSLAQVLTARRQRLDRRAKRRSIEATADLALLDAHRQLDQLLARHELLTLELQTMRKLHEIDESLYQLAVLDYEAAKLAPNRFLPKRKAFLESELDLQLKEIVIRELEGEVLLFCHF
ncbi:MAG: hypothetical protein K9J37_21670 [Saprospiraceae bacterium]|nr:hypothetical protein [Saprospiraceae bacterium]MCF8252531.1 hypothetical protein [Saprospiraceae bacterium]MCF8282555.1 hypothetical protein [Bacteroidales bacterium]MCF8314140.1 hypothetical protein [Saprospiraceae bacterium]MCF8442885.1 hypothetical protein [Saprospiraceae bacterium]